MPGAFLYMLSLVQAASLTRTGSGQLQKLFAYTCSCLEVAQQLLLEVTIHTAAMHAAAGAATVAVPAAAAKHARTLCLFLGSVKRACFLSKVAG